MELDEQFVEPLISCPEGAYEAQFHQHLLDQYKLYVESVQQVSDRREKANNYFLTINSTLVALYGVASAAMGNQRWHVALPVAGFLVCITWYSLVTAYKNLNTAKFRIIHEVERNLPVAWIRSEWQLCEYGVGKKYRPLTHIEWVIPVLFGLLYIALLVYTVWGPPVRPKA